MASEQVLDILLIEDDAVDAEVVRRYLQRASPKLHYAIEHATTLREVLKQAA